MKAYIYPILLGLWMSPIWCNAQDDKNDRPHLVGLRGGIDLSALMGGDDGLDVRSGYYGGLYFNLIKLPVYRLSLGLEYQTAGIADGQTEQRLSYLNLPLNNRIRLGPIYFDGGADLGYKLNETWIEDGVSVDIPSDAKAQPWNVMWHLGGGIKLLFLGIEVRYQNGANEVYPALHNAHLQVGLDLSF